MTIVTDGKEHLVTTIESPIDSRSGGVKVSSRDKTTKALDLHFTQATATPTTLSVAASPEDETITVTSTTGFIAGACVGITSITGAFYSGVQIGAVDGNIVTLDTPIDRNFDAGDSVIPCNRNMNVNGSTTTSIFQIGFVGGADITIDITRIMGYLEDNSVMSDDKFGGLDELTNGIVLRHNNTVIDNVWNVKSNGDLGLICYDTAYTDNAPASNYGFRFRNTYASAAKHGTVFRLMPGETLELLVQDNLTGLVKFNMMAQGHVTD